MTDTVECDLIRFEKRDDHIAIVTLNRPDKRNAINAAMAHAIDAIVKTTETDDEIWVTIITSSGGPAFCAGADLAEAAAGRGHELVTKDGGFAGFVDSKRAKPWIAAVRGAAIGGGLEISLACDIRVCAENTLFGLPEVKRGLLAGAGGAYRLARHVPRGIALEMLATGDPITAERAAHWGLANAVVPDEQVLATAIAMAQQICTNAPLSVRETLAIGRASIECTEDELRTMTDTAVARLMETRDFHEGPRAFMEKRAPRWEAR
ncbi:MAG: enoyl-CoA hydratase-related protein [Novosphingobium sp.]